MSNTQTLSQKQAQLVINNYAPFIVVGTTYVKNIGQVSFGVNGEVVLHDYKVACYGALDMFLRPTLMEQPSMDKFLRFLKEQGYRVVTHVTISMVSQPHCVCGEELFTKMEIRTGVCIMCSNQAHEDFLEAGSSCYQCNGYLPDSLSDCPRCDKEVL